MNIGSYTFQEFKRLAENFHGYAAPGLLIGGYMVEMAKARIPEGTLFEAVVETRKCLPDAVQLLTLCSAGNNWMKVHNLGRYAVSLFDKHTGEGVRVSVDPAKLDAFLAAVFANAEGPISVKTRLGVEKPEEFAAILDIYNRYPICELTIHPRVMRQLYRGQADRAAFAAALPGCRMPVCYNGDVTTAADLHTLEAQYPQLSGIMVGRGIIADPALFRKARGGAPAAREELRGYLDDLYHGYSELFGSAGCAVSRMKGHWFYLIHKFEGAEKLEKQLRKVREPWEYEVVVNQIFTLPFRP